MKRNQENTTPYYNDQTFILLDGEFVKANETRGDLFSQTLHYGLGVFEGIRSYETSEGTHIFKAKEHYERLAMSAQKVHLPLSFGVEEMTKMSYELLKRNNLTDAYLRPLVFTEPSMGLMPCQKTHLMIAAWKWDLLYGNKLADLKISSYRRHSPDSVPIEAKVCGHYVNSILATREAKTQGYNDAIMLDQEGCVAEAAGANLFYEKNEVLYTPAKGHILPGITRATVISLAKNLGMKVVEKQIRKEELFHADGVFLTGTAAEVTGVRSIEGNPMVMAWEDTLGFVLSRKYKQMVTRMDQTMGTFI